MGFTKETASEAGKKSSRKGVPNKVTPEIREAFNTLIENNIDRMEQWLDQIAQNDPAKAFDIITKLSEYVLPKLTRTEFKEMTSVEDILSLPESERKKRIIELRNNLNKTA